MIFTGCSAKGSCPKWFSPENLNLQYYNQKTVSIEFYPSKQPHLLGAFLKIFMSLQSSPSYVILGFKWIPISLVTFSWNLYSDFFVSIGGHVKMQQTVIYVLACPESIFFFLSRDRYPRKTSCLLRAFFFNICSKAYCKKRSIKYNSYFSSNQTFHFRFYKTFTFAITKMRISNATLNF